MARTKASTPRPLDNTCSGCGGMIVSMRLATSSLRSIPNTKGKWATGARLWIETAMMNLLVICWNGAHHSGKSWPVTGHSKKDIDSLHPLLNADIYLIDSEEFKKLFDLSGSSPRLRPVSEPDNKSLRIAH